MRSWRWIVIGLAVVAFVGLVFPLVLIQNRLRDTTSELEQARQAETKLESAIASLKTELDSAEKTRGQLKANLDKANSEKESLRQQFDTAQSDLRAAQSQITQLTSQLDKAKAQIDESPNRFPTLKAKRTLMRLSFNS